MRDAPFDFTRDVTWNDERKAAFHRAAKLKLRHVATALGLSRGQFDLWSNKAGPACSGEVVLHTDHLYVQVSQAAYPGGILFRTCKGRKDYTGGTNNFARLADLNNPAELAGRIQRACMPNMRHPSITPQAHEPVRQQPTAAPPTSPDQFDLFF